MLILYVEFKCCRINDRRSTIAIERERLGRPCCIYRMVNQCLLYYTYKSIDIGGPSCTAFDMLYYSMSNRPVHSYRNRKTWFIYKVLVVCPKDFYIMNCVSNQDFCCMSQRCLQNEKLHCHISARFP
jgi:hypothetical protein